MKAAISLGYCPGHHAMRIKLDYLRQCFGSHYAICGDHRVIGDIYRTENACTSSNRHVITKFGNLITRISVSYAYARIQRGLIANFNSTINY